MMDDPLHPPKRKKKEQSNIEVLPPVDITKILVELKKEELLQILCEFAEDELVQIIAEVVESHSGLGETILKVADKDVRKRRVFVQELSRNTTAETLHELCVQFPV